MIFNDDARTKLKKGIDTLADAVQITLGPKGRNVLINSHLTKDGITVAKAVNLEDYVEDAGAKLIRDACSKTCEDAGDGTTTSTVLARAIISEILNSNKDPYIIKEEIDRVNKSEHSEDEKRRLIAGYENDLAVIDKISKGELKAQDVTASGMKAYQAAVTAVFNYRIQKLNDEITEIEQEIADTTRMYTNADAAAMASKGEADKLRKTTNIAARAASAENRAESNTILQNRLNKINAIIEGNQDPVNLVLNELDEFWFAEGCR